MAIEHDTKPVERPGIGRIVIYRNRDGVDMPAIVTGFPASPLSATDVHLHPFPPPGEAPDMLSHQWGSEMAKDPASPAPQTWRWPERP